ncbi:MAG: SDR family NAD(P)-dependent oxidoreductase [Acidobacteriota bacterium]
MKTILITGATDGIGRETARILRSLNHNVLIHGRSEEKLRITESELLALPGDGAVTSYRADLSRLSEVDALATRITAEHSALDVLINNAGVYNATTTSTDDGFDIRFMVNTIAPYLLTKRLLPLLGSSGRVVNLSSAAQAPVNLKALRGEARLSDHAAYSQSKLALTMWSRSLALELGDRGPMIVAVNPGSLLATKMVKQAFGVPGSDIRIGADILRRAALAPEFASATGQYFDNDSGRFAPPHPDGLDPRKSDEIVRVIETMLTDKM